MVRTVLLAVVAVLMVGCGAEARIDGSSQVAYDRSLEQVTQGMSVAEEEAFRKSLTVVALEGVKGLDGLIEATTGGRIRERVNGMSVAEIHAEAERIDAAKLRAKDGEP